MDETIEAYNKIASHYSKRNYDKMFWMDEFLEFKTMLNGRNVLDVGCGTGRDSKLFTDDSFDYVGIDASRGMIEIARKENNKNFIQMDMNRMGFEKNSFDGFWSAASLLHIPKNEVKNSLNSIRSVMKDQSTGFISLKEGIGEEILLKEHYDAKFYFSYYNIEDFSKILKECKFDVKSYHTKSHYETNWLCFFVRKI